MGAAEEDMESMYTSEDISVPKGNTLYSDEEICVPKASCVVCKTCIATGEDSSTPDGCKICYAKAVALHRIKAASGDSIKAAEDSALHAGGDICVWDRPVPLCREMTKAAEEKRAGVVTTTKKLPDTYIKSLLAGRLITGPVP